MYGLSIIHLVQIICQFPSWHKVNSIIPTAFTMQVSALVSMIVLCHGIRYFLFCFFFMALPVKWTMMWFIELFPFLWTFHNPFISFFCETFVPRCMSIKWGVFTSLCGFSTFFLEEISLHFSKCLLKLQFFMSFPHIGQVVFFSVLCDFFSIFLFGFYLHLFWWYPLLCLVLHILPQNWHIYSFSIISPVLRNRVLAWLIQNHYLIG